MAAFETKGRYLSGTRFGLGGCMISTSFSQILPTNPACSAIDKGFREPLVPHNNEVDDFFFGSMYDNR